MKIFQGQVESSVSQSQLHTGITQKTLRTPGAGDPPWNFRLNWPRQPRYWDFLKVPRRFCFAAKVLPQPPWRKWTSSQGPHGGVSRGTPHRRSRTGRNHSVSFLRPSNLKATFSIRQRKHKYQQHEIVLGNQWANNCYMLRGCAGHHLWKQVRMLFSTKVVKACWK